MIVTIRYESKYFHHAIRHRIPAFRKPTSMLYREMKPEVSRSLHSRARDSVVQMGYGLARLSIPGWTKNISFLQHVRTDYVAHPVHTQWVPWFFTWKQSGWGVKLTAHLHLVSRYPVSGTIPLISLYDSWTAPGRRNVSSARSRQSVLCHN